MDPTKAMHHQIQFFGAGDIPGDLISSGEAAITDDKQSQNTASQLTSLANRPVNIDALRRELQFYDSNEAQIILDGFCNGFPLNYVGPRIPSESKNLKSALIRPEITQQKIDKEVSEGRVAGPFTYPPLVLVEKKKQGEFRLIHHLSYPKNNSVNDFIDPKLCYVKYASFD